MAASEARVELKHGLVDHVSRSGNNIGSSANIIDRALYLTVICTVGTRAMLIPRASTEHLADARIFHRKVNFNAHSYNFPATQS